MSDSVTIDTIKNILTENVNKEYFLSREEAIAIMNLPENDMSLLMEMAGNLRKKYKGNHVSIHLLTNARSGNCSQQDFLNGNLWDRIDAATERFVFGLHR